MYVCGESSNSGLGFPIVPIIMGVGAAIGALKKNKGPKLTEVDAKAAIRQLFLEILEREPDYPANQPRVDCLLRREDKSLGQERFGPGTCNIDDLRTELLQSPEYKDLQMKKAAAVYAPGGTSAAFPYSGAGDIGGALSGGIGGIPFTWIAVGLGLVLLMKR